MTTRFPSGLWAIVLIASILLNGLVLGVVVAGAAHGVRVDRIRPPADMASPLPRSDREIPDAVRDEMVERLRRSAQESRPLFEEARLANEEALRALAADPFDPEDVRAAFDRATAARAALEARAHETAISLFSDLPLEVRQDLVRRAGPRIIFRRFDDGPGRNGPGGFDRDGNRSFGPDRD